MRNWKLAVATGSLALAAITPTAFANTQTQSYVETMHGWVSFHSAASLSSPIVGRLQLGDKAPLIQKANAYWYEIKWNGQNVYITTNGSYTEVVQESVAPSASSGPGSQTSASTPTPAPGPIATTVTTNTQYVETNHGWVDYHSAASLSSPIVGRLQLGDKAPLVKQVNAYWYEIQWNGQQVYITTNSTYTQVVTETTSTPSSATTTSVNSPNSNTPAATSSSAPTSSSSSSSTSVNTTIEPTWQQEADKVIAVAKTQLGVPYLWGKQEPGIGFDCSNFTAWSYNTALGIQFAGSSAWQFNNEGTPVPLNQIREGDLLFFAVKGNSTGSGHVGIYEGDGMVIQEGGGWGKVTEEPLATTWLGKNLVVARRVIN